MITDGYYQSPTGNWYRRARATRGLSYAPAACDNPECAKPFMARRITKGTRARFCSRPCSNKAPERREAREYGETRPNSPLIAEDVRLIRASTASGPELAHAWDVSETTIRNIRSGKTWSRVK